MLSIMDKGSDDFFSSLADRVLLGHGETCNRAARRRPPSHHCSGRDKTTLLELRVQAKHDFA